MLWPHVVLEAVSMDLERGIVAAPVLISGLIQITWHEKSTQLWVTVIAKTYRKSIWVHYFPNNSLNGFIKEFQQTACIIQVAKAILIILSAISGLLWPAKELRAFYPVRAFDTLEIGPGDPKGSRVDSRSRGQGTYSDTQLDLRPNNITLKLSTGCNPGPIWTWPSYRSRMDPPSSMGLTNGYNLWLNKNSHGKAS